MAGFKPRSWVDDPVPPAALRDTIADWVALIAFLLVLLVVSVRVGILIREATSAGSPRSQPKASPPYDEGLEQQPQRHDWSAMPVAARSPGWAGFPSCVSAAVGARDAGAALDAVIADSPGWEGLGDLVATAAALAATVASDPLNHVLAGYSRFRRYTPRMLRTLDIEASPVAKPLLEAVDVLRNAATARPTGFLRPNSKWSRLLRTQPDHRLWETAVLFHLRDAFRAGDLWLARSRRYGDIRKTMLSASAVVGADRSLPVPASPTLYPHYSFWTTPARARLPMR